MCFSLARLHGGGGWRARALLNAARYEPFRGVRLRKSARVGSGMKEPRCRAGLVSRRRGCEDARVSLFSLCNRAAMLVFPAMNEPNFPTPEELQKKLSDFMKSQFGGQVSISTHLAADQDDTVPETPAEEGPDVFSFSHLL